jgi:signal transduction histidine kinase
MSERASEGVKQVPEKTDISSMENDDGDSEERVELLFKKLRERTAELEEANRELQRVSHYRSLFLARMSHELRTPLTSILGFSEILLDQEELGETQRRFCQKIQDSGFQLQASLNQLVDLSRIEAGQTEVFLQEFTLRETLRESCANVARSAQKKQVKVEYEMEPEITTVVSDQGKLRQILFNFIAWAVSRSPVGETVNISVEINDQAHLNINIRDQGDPVDDIDHIFDPEHATNAREPNTNELGIIIARKLLEMMNGTVVLNDTAASGLETTIQLPARPLRG